MLPFPDSALFLALALAALPSLGQEARDHAQDARSEAAALHFELALAPGPDVAVEVRVRCSGSDEESTLFQVEGAWGGVSTGGRDLECVEARDAAGTVLETERPNAFQWRIHHPPGAALEARFRIAANAHQDEAEPSTYRRPIVNDHLFHSVGIFALPVPTHLRQDETRPITLVWSGFEEAGWETICSFGAGDGPHELSTSVSRLWNALYVAGKIRVYEERHREKPVYISIEGEWAFADEDFVGVASSIVAEERAFFDDWKKPFYWISLIGVGPTPSRNSSLGGTGLTNSFSLGLHRSATLDVPAGRGASVQRLLAHEMFHEWNGLEIQRHSPEELVYWFSEGFTDFYARRLLYRGGWIDRERYAALANEAIEYLWVNRAKAAPNARIREAYWSDPDVQKLPYHRGDVVAMLVDHTLRTKTEGERSLDDLMRELLQAARTEGQKVDTELLLGMFERELGAEITATLRRVIVDGATPELPPDLFAPCLQLAEHEVTSFDLGFDFAASVEAQRVTGVREGSPAYEAGLRDGLPLVGWSVERGNPSRFVVLQVEEQGDVRDVRYLPQGAPQRVPVLRVPAGAPPEAACDGL